MVRTKKTPEELRMTRLSCCRRWGEKNHERTLALHARRRARTRDEAFDRYGARCHCCGETNRSFLALDHIDGKGGEHRRLTRLPMADWAKRNGWPPIFRTACHNCNQGTHTNGGTCPHNATANRAAERLLLACLTEDLQATYRERGSFVVTTATGTYRIDRRAGANVHLLNDRGRIAGSFCARPRDVPVELAMLAQKLWLETNEEEFKRKANFRRWAS